MKKSAKILIGVIVVISFLLGLLIGNMIKSPSTDSSELAGTMGKMKKLEKYKVSENDKQLRSDLLSNATLLKDCQNYYSYFSSTCVKLCDDLDFSIQAAENDPGFMKNHSEEIEKIKQYRQKLEQTNKDLQQAVSALQNISDVDESSFSQILKSANAAVPFVNYKQAELSVFTSSLESYLMGNNPYLFPDLIKAHDLLSVNQLIPVV